MQSVYRHLILNINVQNVTFNLPGRLTIIHIILYPPVTGASMSIMVFSDLSSDAPSLTMRNAAASSIRPSSMKCCFNMSGRGLFVLESHISAVVNFRPGGNGTPKNKIGNGYSIIEYYYYLFYYSLDVWSSS